MMEENDRGSGSASTTSMNINTSSIGTTTTLSSLSRPLPVAVPLPNKLRHREFGLPILPPKSNSFWNHSGSFIDTMTKNMRTLHCPDGQSQKVNSESGPLDVIPIYCMARIPKNPGLIVADESGYIHTVQNWFDPRLQDLNKHPCFVSSLRICEATAITSVNCVAGKVLVGAGSGCFCAVDLATMSLLRYYNCHEKAIKKVESRDGDVIVSCSKDNIINIYDLRVKANLPVNSIRDAHSLQLSDSVAPRGRPKPKSKYLPATSLSNAVMDVVFIDDDQHQLISCGVSDGRLKQWDLRVTYKHMKKCHPVTVVEYPATNNIKGYSCLQVSGSKLFASSVSFETYQFGLGSLEHEATYKSLSKINNYTKLDVSQDGHYLAVGSEAPQVHVFKTVGVGATAKSKNDLNYPIASLQHSDLFNMSVCCPLFSAFSDLMLTTGGDASIICKWSPLSYLTRSEDLRKMMRKEELENPPETSDIKTEFKVISTKSALSNSINCNDNQENDKDIDKFVRSAKRVCFAKLDSFPNYVLDGMKLPHVVPKIKIKLRSRIVTASKNWLMSPDTRSAGAKATTPFSPTNTAADLETTPKRRATVSRKRKKFCDESLSPKIIRFFKASPSSHLKFSEN